MVGACDLTLLPAGGAKKSREGLVADVPSQLALAPDAHFLYLTGMVVPAAYRRRRIGQALLARSEALAPRMTPAPCCIALHVDRENDPARALYRAAGYRSVGDGEEGEGGGGGSGGEKKVVGWGFPALGMGKNAKTAPKRQVLMVKWLPVNAGRSEEDVSES